MNSLNNNETVFSNRWPMAVAVAIVSMVLLPLLARSIIFHAPEYDELLHILSARNINLTGISSIADGLYPRAELYSRLIAWVTQFGNDELLVARLPALIFGVLLVGMVSAWVSLRAGWIAGLVAGCLLVISPPTLYSSVLVRFYTVHTLVMAGLLIFWFESVSRPRSLRNVSIFVIVSAGLIWLGLQLHALTQITVLAGVAGMAMLLVYDYRQILRGWISRSPVLWSLGGLSLVLLGGWVFMSMDIMNVLRGDNVPLWSSGKANNYAYYVSALGMQLPFVWPLFPIMLIFAFIDKPRLTIFCLTVLLVALLVNSIAAQKATRYFFHAFPVICVIWGVGFQRLLAWLTGELQRIRGWGTGRSMTLVLMVAAICFLNAHEVKRGLKLLVNRGAMDETIPVRDEPDWSLALGEIGELANQVDTLVVTSGVKGLYTFGRYDYELSTTVVQETDTGLDFGMDQRTGRQVIGLPDSAEQVIDADGDTLFVLENRMLNQTYSTPVETVTLLNQRCELIDLAHTGSQLTAWLCSEDN